MEENKTENFGTKPSGSLCGEAEEISQDASAQKQREKELPSPGAEEKAEAEQALPPVNAEKKAEAADEAGASNETKCELQNGKPEGEEETHLEKPKKAKSKKISDTEKPKKAKGKAPAGGEAPKTKKSKLPIIIIAAVLGAALIAGAVWFIIDSLEPKHEHTWVTINDIAPTCQEKGYSGEIICSDCESPQSFGHELDIIDHIYEERICTMCEKHRPSEGLEVVNSFILGIGSCTDSVIVIPEQVNGEYIEGIAEGAFENNSTITEIYVPETMGDPLNGSYIFHIYSNAFKNCDNLESVEIYCRATAIADAFISCDKLKSFTVGASVDLHFLNYPYAKNNPFAECYALENVYVPYTGWSSLQKAFAGLENIKYTEYGNAYYLGTEESPCINLMGLTSNDIDSIELSKDAQGVELSLFDNCPNLASITVEEGSKNYASVDGVLYNKDVTSLKYYPHAKPDDTYIIPDTVTEIKATIESTISTSLFIRSKNLRHIILGAGMTVLSGHNFKNCSWLTEITLPDTLVSIGSSVFEGCSGLTEITLPSTLVSIGSSAFLGCSELTSIVIPDGVTEIPDGAFKNCTGLAKVTIPSGVKSIGNSAFSGCTALMSISLPESLETIGNYSFVGCETLLAITVPENVTSVSSSAFNNCENLKEITNLSQVDFTNIGNFDVIIDSDGNKQYAEGKENIEYFTTDDGFKFRKDESHYTLIAYVGDSLDVTLPANINGRHYQIEKLIFAPGAYSITIPASVTHISTMAFENVNAKSFTVEAGNTSLSSLNGNLYNADKTKLIRYASQSEGASFTVPQSVVAIERFAFRNSKNLTRIDLPQGLMKINYAAFEGCTGLSDVYINSLDKYFDISFQYYPNSSNSNNYNNSANPFEYAKNLYVKNELLTSITFDNDNIADSQKIRFIDSIKTVILVDLTVIESNTFYGCLMEEVVFPDTLEKINTQAFSQCLNLRTLVFPASLKVIGTDAFRSCGIESITFNEGLTSVLQSAFMWCNSLKSVTLPTSLTSVASRMFEGCTSLESVTLHGKVTSIGYNAFYNCSSLKELVLPNSITSIGSSAFYNHHSDFVLKYRGTEEEWSKVENASGLDAVFVPNTCDSHIEETLARVEPDCTNDGLTEGKQCAVCGTITVAQEPIPATGHTPVTIPGKAASCTENGLTDGSKCSVCQATITYQETIYAEGHKMDAAGKECTVCGYLKPTAGLAYRISMGNAAITGMGSATDTDIVIPTEIDGYTVGGITSAAFKGNTTITSIVIPDGMTGGMGNFAGCTSLKYVKIGSGATIPTSCFEGCTALETVVLSDAITTIGSGAFKGCTSLTSVNLPASLGENMGAEIFSGCTKLERIVIPAGVTRIAKNAFSGCTRLWDITIESGVTHIDDGAFFNCTGMGEFVMPDSVLTVGSGIFEGCTYLERVTLSAKLKFIQNNMFIYCERLESINIPVTVTSIGSLSFGGCAALSEIRYGGTTAQWEALTKDSTWNLLTGSYTVVCSDGNLAN